MNYLNHTRWTWNAGHLMHPNPTGHANSFYRCSTSTG